MDNFASASMLRLLLRAMAAHGLPPPLPLPEAAHVPLTHKQQVVAAIVRAGGLPLLLALAQQVHHIEGEPLPMALTGARDPHDFLARWQRLERYVHASHRVRCRDHGIRTLVLEHTAPEGKPLMAAESVAVLGVWIGALRLIGTQGLRIDIGGRVVLGDGASHDWASAPMHCWRLQWAAADPTVTPQRGAGLAASLPEGAWPEPAAALARWMARDLAVTPRAADAAVALGLPLRTMQRRLAAAGLSFSAVLGEVRVRRAAAGLAHGSPTLAEIGYLCGYADQSHFTREFTRRAGMPPARYRAAAGTDRD